MSRLINWALTDLMLTHPEIVTMGEDIGRKGGVYGVTQKLTPRFGPHLMIDTLLDEQSILGLAIGMAQTASSRSRTSSSSPIFTTPGISCAARPPPCRSSPMVGIPIQ